MHLAGDGRDRPLSFTVTAGTRIDCIQAETVIVKIRVAGGGWRVAGGGWRVPGRNGPVFGRSGWWPTGATRPVPSAPAWADAASRRSFPNASTSSRADAGAVNVRLRPGRLPPPQRRRALL
ncbi:hypothetical protein GCM10010335_45000 [Streptomyces galbus]|nr:hypothetical protein GCM10010335_45000 [Streptomyces galbus]